MSSNTKKDLQQVQKTVQANQTLSACDNSDELSDNELAAVNGGQLELLTGLLGGLPIVGGLLGGGGSLL